MCNYLPHVCLMLQSSALREIEESMQVFSELVRAVQRAQAELVLAIEEKQRQTERWAQGLIAELEKEIVDLHKRNTDLEHLSRTEDHIHFLQVRWTKGGPVFERVVWKCLSTHLLCLLILYCLVTFESKLIPLSITTQKFPTLCTHPPTKDWSGTRVHTEQCVGTIRRAVTRLEDTLEEEIEKMAANGWYLNMMKDEIFLYHI